MVNEVMVAEGKMYEPYWSYPKANISLWHTSECWRVVNPFYIVISLTDSSTFRPDATEDERAIKPCKPY